MGDYGVVATGTSQVESSSCEEEGEEEEEEEEGEGEGERRRRKRRERRRRRKRRERERRRRRRSGGAVFKSEGWFVQEVMHLPLLLVHRVQFAVLHALG